ncbi:MAG TPA: argininosuccinate lyase [Candidatus Avamphibacillus sp.]|nr:argininosuccinate lyase [Candidatus Avamphibacillus sp.]
MQPSIRKKIMQREGKKFPSKTYQELVLEPAYNQAKVNSLRPMIQIHLAHLIMLEEEGIIQRKEAKKIIKAIQKINIPKLEKGSYNPVFEDLFFEVEHFLIEEAGEVAGNLHIARSRNDMGIALYRMNLRKRLLRLIEAALELRESLIELTKEHIDTIMIGYTHTQQAQPTTLGHYFHALTNKLTRDIKRFISAYQTVNRSSMGSAALTTSGFPINRKRVQELLGFEEIIENAWDAVSAADYIGEVATSVQLAAINLGRSTQDLLLWGTQEFDVFTLFEPYVQISSIMPQKQNPVSIEHIRSLLSSVVGDAQTVLMMMHNTPYGDIVDTEDDMQPFIWNAIERLEKIYYLLSSVLMTMKVNKETLLERAKKSFANVTELADTLVRSEKISFRKAHEIVSSAVRELVNQGKASLESLRLHYLNKHAEQVLGHKLQLTETELKKALDANYFVHIRSLEGGPSAEAMNTAIEKEITRQDDLIDWLKKKNNILQRAHERIEERITSLMDDE